MLSLKLAGRSGQQHCRHCGSRLAASIFLLPTWSEAANVEPGLRTISQFGEAIDVVCAYDADFRAVVFD